MELGELLAGLGWHLGQRSTVPALLDKAAPGVEGTAPAARHPGVADPYATRMSGRMTPEVPRERRVQWARPSELQFSPGCPVPNLASMADQVEALWPLRSAIAGAITAIGGGRGRGRRRQNPQRRGQAIQEAFQVELITDMLMVGTQHMREEALRLHTDHRQGRYAVGGDRLHFLDSREGAAVYWLWVTSEHIHVAQILHLIRAHIDRFHPYVQPLQVSHDIAALIVRSVEDTATREGLRLLESTLLEEVTDAPDSDGGSELSIAETGAGAAAKRRRCCGPSGGRRLSADRSRR